MGIFLKLCISINSNGASVDRTAETRGRMVLLNTVKCLIIMDCGILCYPMLSSRDKKDLSFFSKKGPIFLKKGVKKEQIRANQDVFSSSFQFSLALCANQKYCADSTINKEKE